MEKTIHKRALYDRRDAFDRRKVPYLKINEEGKRFNMERRCALKERRSGWIRDTTWSSILVDLLK